MENLKELALSARELQYAVAEAADALVDAQYKLDQAREAVADAEAAIVAAGLDGDLIGKCYSYTGAEKEYIEMYAGFRGEGGDRAVLRVVAERNTVFGSGVQWTERNPLTVARDLAIRTEVSREAFDLLSWCGGLVDAHDKGRASSR